MLLRNMPPEFVNGPPRSRVLATPWPSIDRSWDRPGYQLTPERLWFAYRHADAGSPLTQTMMFEDIIELDGHLRGKYEARMRSVAVRDFDVLPGGPDAVDAAAADALRDRWERTNFEDALWHAQESVFYGYAGMQPLWDLVDGLVSPVWFVKVEHNRWTFDEQGLPRLRTEENQYPGIRLEGPPGSWWWCPQQHRLTQRAGLMRTVSWWAVFKRMSVRDWIVFAEKFGLPIVLGQYQEMASDETRRVLLQALEDIGTDGQAMISDAAQIVVKDASLRGGDISSLHPAVIQMCNAEISKLIAGSTLTQETGGPGSFALGKVHENQQTSLYFADARVIQRSWRRNIAAPFVLHNPRFAKAKPPLLHIYVQPEVDPWTDVQIDEKLQAMGAELDRDDVGRRYGRRWATAPERALKRPDLAIAERDSETKRIAAEKPAPAPAPASR